MLIFIHIDLEDNKQTMKYIPLEVLKKEIYNNSYNRWACDMLEFIANKEWWEETQTKYFKEFYKNIL